MIAALLLAQTIAITGGTVYPVSGPKIDNATVLIRNGVIVAVGANVPVPEGATRIDAAGKWVTPGFFNAGTQLGLTEISAVQQTNDGRLAGNDVAASFNVANALNASSQLIPVTRVSGVTTALSAPSGGLISGQAVVIDLAGDRPAAMLASPRVAMVFDFNARDAGGGSRAGIVARLRRVLEDARQYNQRRADYNRAQMQQLSAPAADLEALQPVLAGTLPVLALADHRADIDAALKLAADFRLKLIIGGGAEGWMVADRLAAAKVPVILAPLTNIPSYTALGARYSNAARLAQAGVKIAFTTEGDASHNARNVKQEAGNAVSYGLSWDDALRALTLAPAEMFGLQARYGSLQAGRVANVVVWSGDPFEFSTAVEHVFIRGQEIPLTSRQGELLERYKTLPPKY
jgi:imidazolonepropionase-like amidohydrolase